MSDQSKHSAPKDSPRVDKPTTSSLFPSDAVFPASLVARAIRHGPYRTTANALAEIVDNSYDAEASEIHIALIGKAGERIPSIIAVLDNGVGMDNETLRHCVQHGQHQRGGHGGPNRNRIGKFGVGLLSASFHQCKALEVFSWQDGLDENNVRCTRMSVDNCPDTLPQVTSQPLPNFFEQAFITFDREHTGLDEHGTLVVWRDIDQLTWRTTSTLADKLHFEIGRIYRNFLDGTRPTLKVAINSVEQSGDSHFTTVRQTYVKPVDPLFIRNWACTELDQYKQDLSAIAADPSKYSIEAEEIRKATENPTLFVPCNPNNPADDGYDEAGRVMQTEYIVNKPDSPNEILGKYRIIASYRRPKIVRAAALVRSGNIRNPGDTPYGKLAERLRGVSILRGGREIALDTNWLRADLTVDRWVSLSIDFDPSLDAVFGVSNDKQQARGLSSLAQVRSQDIDPRESEYNPDVVLAAKNIHRILGGMRRMVHGDSPARVQPAVISPTDPAHESVDVLIDVTQKMSNRVARHPELSVSGLDDIEGVPEKLRVAFEGATVEQENASNVRTVLIVKHRLKADFATDHLESGNNMFTPVHNMSGALIIRLHARHPVYGSLSELLELDDEEQTDEVNEEAIKSRLMRAVSIIRHLFLAYGRAEIEADERYRASFERARHEWSVVAKELFENDE